MKANVARHEKVCEVMLRKTPQKASPFSKEELGEIYGDTNCSQKDFNCIIRAISKKLGRHWFPKNIAQAASDYAKAMGTHFETKVVEFQDKDGNPIQRTISVPVDTDAFLDAVGVGRGIREESLVLSSDKGSLHFYLLSYLPLPYLYLNT